MKGEKEKMGLKEKRENREEQKSQQDAFVSFAAVFACLLSREGDLRLCQ